MTSHSRSAPTWICNLPSTADLPAQGSTAAKFIFDTYLEHGPMVTPNPKPRTLEPTGWAHDSGLAGIVCLGTYIGVCGVPGPGGHVSRLLARKKVVARFSEVCFFLAM